jgi:hypothetical protein
MSVGYRCPISIGLINYEWVINVDMSKLVMKDNLIYFEDLWK